MKILMILIWILSGILGVFICSAILVYYERRHGYNYEQDISPLYRKLSREAVDQAYDNFGIFAAIIYSHFGGLMLWPITIPLLHIRIHFRAMDILDQTENDES